MCSTRLVFSYAVVALVVIGAHRDALGALPVRAAAMAQELLNEPGPLEKRSNPITPDNPVPRRIHAVMPLVPANAASEMALAIVALRITLDESGRVAEIRRAVDGVREGPSVTGAFVRAAVEAVRQWLYEPPVNAPMSFGVTFRFGPESDVQLVSHAGISLRSSGSPPPPSPAPSWAEGAVRIGGAIKPPMKVTHVQPAYPSIAQASRVQGVVIVEARIEPNGRIEHARILQSIPLLDQAALDAVKQWEFTPTLLNGVPVPVIMVMTVPFTSQ